MSIKTSKREERAIELLFHPETYPGMIERNSAEIIFLLLKNDTLGDRITFSLFHSKQGYYLRRIIWKQRSFYKLESPDTYCSEIRIPSEKLVSILTKFSKFNLSNMEYLKQTPIISIDGFEYGIYSHGHKIIWHDEPSNEMLELSQWYENTLAQFEKFLA